MTKGSMCRRAMEQRCLRRLREAARCVAEAEFCVANGMPRGATVWTEMAHDAEQRAEAELRTADPERPAPLLPDYEQRLGHYLENRISIAGPIAHHLGLVPPNLAMWTK